jgi:GT2 family glycosyltransferase
MEETDWALQMHKAGWRVFFVPAARVVHAQGRSVGASAISRMLFYQSRYLYFRKWHPKTYPVYFTLCVVRLAVNSLLTLAGFVITAGFVEGTGRKLRVYGALIRWHLKGCPSMQPRAPEGFDD